MVATASDATDSEKNHVPADTFVVRDRDGSRDIGPNPLAFGLKVGSREFDNFCCGATAVNAERAGDVSQPMLLVVDNGWAAADGWDRRREVALSLADRALRAGRRVVLLATAPPTDGSAIEVIALGAAEARSAVNKLLPLPWPTDRGEAADALADWQGGFAALADVRWLTDGLDGPGTEEMTERLRGLAL